MLTALIKHLLPVNLYWKHKSTKKNLDGSTQLNIQSYLQKKSAQIYNGIHKKEKHYNF